MGAIRIPARRSVRSALHLLTASLLALFALACSDGGTDTPSEPMPGEPEPEAPMPEPDPQPAPEPEPEPEPEAMACGAGDFARSGFTADSVTLTPRNGSVIVTARSAPGTPYDSLAIQLYEGYDNSPTEPGRVSLDGINYRDCGVCVLGFSGCDGDGACEKTWYAQEGTVNFTALPGDGGAFAAQLEGVVLEEVTIDWDTYVSTPVDDGGRWCADGLSYDEAVEILPSRCDPDLVEDCARVGDPVSEITMTGCADEVRST